MNMNNTEGFIAVWLGKFDSEESFKEYIKVHYEYDDDIDDIDSQFEKDFDLQYYDRSIVESRILKQDSNSLKELFDGASYLGDYIEKLDDVEKKHLNAIILVYDFKYEGNKHSEHHDGNRIEFFGNIEYEEIVDLSWMGL